MASFPNIPALATSTLLRSNQADTSGTRTFPDLSGLTKGNGDLLIAIIAGYQCGTGTDAAFSSWGGSFTEFVDRATTTTMCIGAAYKWSTGAETGTFSVTQASVTGHASMMLLAIAGPHPSTVPEATAKADGTAAAADPAALTPSWGADNTLWISVVSNGMTSATGSWTACGAGAPTNYTGWVDTNTTDNSTIGQSELAVSFRQTNTSSENVGTNGTHDLSNARNSALVIGVRPAAAEANLPIVTLPPAIPHTRPF